jgi:hypothetical protein
MNKTLDRATVLSDFALQWKRLEHFEQVSFVARGSGFTSTYQGKADRRGIVLVRSSDF